MTTEMTEPEFEQRYRPIDHRTLGSESEDWCDGEHLKGVEEERIWTVTEGDDGSGWINPGILVVNRLNFVVTDRPWKTGQEVAMLWDADDFEEDAA